MSWQSSAVYIHYVLVLLPAPFLLMALAVAGRIESGVGVIRAACLTAICAIQMAAVVAFYASLEASLAAPRTAVSPSQWQAALNRAELGAKQAGIGELHGLPLRYWQSVADRVRVAASLAPLHQGAGPRDVVVVTGIQDDGNRHLDERRKALEYLLGPDLQARFPLEGLTVVPTTVDTLFLTIPEQDLPRSFLRDVRRLADAPLPGTNGTTRLWLVRALPPRELIRPRVPANARFESGVRLLGLDGPPRAGAGQTLALVSYWLVEREDATPDEDDQPFVELVDASGTPRAHQAGAGLPSHQWRAGDLLIQRASLTAPVDLPVGQYHLAAGISRQDGARARVVDDQGRAGGDAAAVATVTIENAP